MYIYCYMLTRIGCRVPWLASHSGGSWSACFVVQVRLALNDLFNAMDGYWWKNYTGWRTTTNYCQGSAATTME